MGVTSISWTSHNGLSNTIAYDSDLRPTSIAVPSVQSLSFAWDAADRMTGITNGLNASWSQALGYDALDRLTSMASSARSESYQYDADGNRVRQVINGVTTNFAYPAGSNRLASASGGFNATYGYNAYGSTTLVNGLTAYTYSPFGRLVNASGAAFEISAEDQRLRKSMGGNVTYFVPAADGSLLAENVNGTWKDYVWLNGRMVAMITGGAVYAVHADQTGRAMALTAANKSVVWSSRNDPFDRTTVTGDPALFRLGFPGQYWDAEDSLWHNGYRDYDYRTGRYIQSDPIGLGGGVNTYAYVGNNPVSYIDPLGLKPGDCYPTIDVAGENAVNDINGTSIHTNTEYAGWIYGNPNGTYSYTAPIKGTTNTDTLVYTSGDVGMYHAHGADIPPGYGSFEHFSPQDIKVATGLKMPSYLGTPLGIIKKFDPTTGNVTVLPYPGKNNSDACGCR